MARVVGPLVLACLGPRLAGKSAGHNVDEAAPRLAVELSNVCKHRERWQASVRLSRLQDAAAILVDLDGADRGVPQQHAAEDATARAGEQVELA
ncbi:MAG: hypothetical protein GOVbin7015_32 [Prokaryotic dsDNA virus sp.]|nr:MAG: hypothetical protein GOVbin7015_32 [Prokaryotic dsDNA virus sp.]